VYVTGNPAGVQDDALAVFRRDAATGELTFLEVHTRGVTDAQGLGGPESVAVSPDGRHVYVATDIDDAVVVFARHPVSGTLTFVQKLEEQDLGLNTVNGASAVTVSPDNRGVYVVSRLTDSLLVFGRNTHTGRLSLLEQHVDDVGEVDGLQAARSVVASLDNQNVYVAASEDSAVSVFGRVGELPDTHLVMLPAVLRE
jgi:6-phosphogluconolactonase (cycloisomerase 2 family)